MKLVFSTLLLLAAATTAHGAASDFVGTWQNTDANATGIVKIVIDASQHIRAYGACSPNPCDYGAVDFSTYGLNTGDTNHRLGTGRWTFNFKEVILTAKLTSARVMKVEDFNRFTDTSGRQNYWMNGTYKKVSDSFQ